MGDYIAAIFRQANSVVVRPHATASGHRRERCVKGRLDFLDRGCFFHESRSSLMRLGSAKREQIFQDRAH